MNKILENINELDNSCEEINQDPEVTNKVQKKYIKLIGITENQTKTQSS
jgi:hypothetical protein|tara:strand:+ start:202 stop:348 length:147 start_codon:yes stop_codon:yes gene_type:complete